MIHDGETNDNTWQCRKCGHEQPQPYDGSPVIFLGSKSQCKYDATITALHALKKSAHVGSRSVASGVNAQPVGYDEISRGASNRARAALDGTSGIHGLGIENGIWQARDGVWRDVAIATLICPDGTSRSAAGTSVVVPTKIVEEAQRQGFDKTTVGAVCAEQTGCDPNNPHHTFAVGAPSRLECMTHALIDLLTLLPQPQRKP